MSKKIISWNGSADPDPYQKETDPQHYNVCEHWPGLGGGEGGNPSFFWRPRTPWTRTDVSEFWKYGRLTGPETRHVLQLDVTKPTLGEFTLYKGVNIKVFDY